jgi:ubiquinone/menaquinone biosynthesis C-methylase UbiE
MEENYTKKYYNLERNHWWFLVRQKIIEQQLLRSLPKQKSLKILNVGASTGQSTLLLQPYGEVVSVEKDHDTCQFLKTNFQLQVVQASAEALPFDNDAFDVVCVFDVIEHIQEDSLAISELYRVCKKGGVLYCTVPAFDFLFSDHDKINHHYRRYNKYKIGQLVEKQFSIEYQTYFNCILFFPILLYRLAQIYLIKPSTPVSDFESPSLLNGTIPSFLFKQLFSIEIFLLRYIKLPFGVSFLCRARK